MKTIQVFFCFFFKFIASLQIRIHYLRIRNQHFQNVSDLDTEVQNATFKKNYSELLTRQCPSLEKKISKK
jgi:hypothetical protein